MSVFSDLQAGHESLLGDQQRADPAEFALRVKKYIADAISVSADISAPRERDQIRANLRYWARYVSEIEHQYPSIELFPPRRPYVERPSREFWLAIGGIAAILIGLLLTLGFIGRLQIEGYQASATEFVSNLTSSPAMSQTPKFPSATSTQAVVKTLTPFSVTERTPARTPTFISLTSPLPSPTLTPTPTNLGIVAQITSPLNGDVVSPRTTISGSYENLQPGWTIIALLQPLTKGGRYYPVKSSAITPFGQSSGQWAFEAVFGQDTELQKDEQYIMRLALVTDEFTRQLVLKSAESGLDELPKGVVIFPQIVTVSRSRYVHLKEVRIIYGAFVAGERNNEIVSVRPDGSDYRQITFTLDVSELQPSLSPSGRQIAFVAQTLDAQGQETDSLWLMDSDGQNRMTIGGEAGAVYENPTWSPDGRYIAFSARIPKGQSLANRGLYIYDVLSGETIGLVDVFPPSRYPSWSPTSDSIAFSTLSKTTSTSGLFSVQLSNHDVGTVYDTEAQEVQPSVSPDGKQMVFVSYPEDTDKSNRDVYLLDLATNKVEQLTSDPALDWYPVWHPNGQSIYFISFRKTGSSAIWAINVDGSNLRPIANVPLTGSISLGLMDAYLPMQNLLLNPGVLSP